jgi:hypothetical protein
MLRVSQHSQGAVLKIGFGLLAVFLFACARQAPFQVTSQTITPPPIQLDPSAKTAAEVLSYRPGFETSVPSLAKFFLVACSASNANFAQEVVDQIEVWKSAGFKDEEVACYYALPSEKAFQQDSVQYEKLAPVLKQCFPASPKLLWKHLKAAAQAKPDFLYIYATSHGARPLSETLKDRHISFPQKGLMGKILKAFPDLDQFQLVMDVGSSYQTREFLSHLKEIAGGADLKDFLFTPRYLKEALKEFPVSLPKYVVVQGCYSGGFLFTENKKLQADSLVDLENLTALTASSSELPSFGCTTGTDRTYFGQSFLRALREHVASPNSVEWEETYKTTEKYVSHLETEKNTAASHPQFFTNRKR